MDKPNLSYRKGWPDLPPLPVGTIMEEAKSSVENWNARLETVRSILKAQDVESYRVFFAFRVPQDTDGSLVHDGYLTLIIAIDTTVESRIHRAIVHIRQSLKSHESTKLVTIEAIDYRVLDRGLCTVPLGKSNKRLLDVWPEVCDMVRTEISANNQQWPSI
jgi:hypothetical protein